MHGFLLCCVAFLKIAASKTDPIDVVQRKGKVDMVNVISQNAEKDLSAQNARVAYRNPSDSEYLLDDSAIRKIYQLNDDQFYDSKVNGN